MGKHYKDLIFDLSGVLFTLDKLTVLSSISMWDIAKYIVLCRKNPFNKALDTLNVISAQDIHTTPAIAYKNYFLPACLGGWIAGTLSNEQALAILKQQIAELDRQHYFKHDLERYVTENIAQAIFSTDTLAKALKPVEALFCAIKEIKHKASHRVFLLSNLDAQTYKSLSQDYPDLFALFDGIAISGLLHMVKPQPEIFNYVLKEFAIDAQDAIFFDDQIENVEAARAVGIDSVLCEDSSSLVYMLSSLTNIHDIKKCDR